MRHAVVLAGGGGTRLWPASRRARPKQLLALGGRAGESLLAATTRRLCPLVGGERVWVVTAAAQVPAARSAVLPDVPTRNVIGEPAARNTAAAIGLAAVVLFHQDPDAVLGVIPADQHVADEAAFRDTVARAFALAEARSAIVTIGLKPTRPETGYGWLELGEDIEGGGHRVRRFVEKPDRAAAEAYLAGGRHLWNGGMFFLRAARVLDELERHLPATHAALAEIAQALRAGGPAAAGQAASRVYPAVPSVSIDYAVMEKTEEILTLPGDFGWSDIGSWTALADVRPADAAGNVTQGLVVAHDARGNVAVCDEGTLVALLGVDDLVVVQAGNSVLVCPKDRAQGVRDIVRLLEQRKLDPHL